jgi:hypothetical protein
MRSSRSDALLIVWTLALGWFIYGTATAVVVALDWLREGACVAGPPCSSGVSAHRLILWCCAGLALLVGSAVVVHRAGRSQPVAALAAASSGASAILAIVL